MVYYNCLFDKLEWDNNHMKKNSLQIEMLILYKDCRSLMMNHLDKDCMEIDEDILEEN